ncbi:1,3-beta-glucanosyltransferase Gel2 [Calycina marina]|uniref:1,3-beta-glucanosyltransferase n=1 Tax=Calycina marina TaxID=1763456 RepID=A0A9P8CIR8_9HELO|nr:1,3-beta-glucanosyltransferase Gel2 [Calycina marina]
MIANTFAFFLALFSSLCAAVPSLEVQGSDFVNPKDGTRFQIVGVAYQPGGSSDYNPGNDPLSNGTTCLRDAALMQRLGVNAIRVYNLDPTINHDLCASIFNAVGIYLLLDVNSPLQGESINRAAPWESYNAVYVNRIFEVVEAFKGYPNTLLFFAGNEVINEQSDSSVPSYMRAVTRDLKNYIAKHSNRTIPVGYSAADVRPLLLDTWNYLQCSLTGDATDPSRVDVFALNSYSWCGDSSFQTSGYDVLVSDFANTSVPVFFSEYGCIQPYPRVFTEVPALYGPLVTPVLSGGIVYEYTQEVSNYGLVTLNDDGSAYLVGDFDTFQKQLNTLSITTLQDTTAQNTTVVPPTCNDSLITTTGTFSKNFTIPAVPSEVQDLLDNGISNPNNGKLVALTVLDVTQTVKSSSGVSITGLKITPLADDESNTPSGQTQPSPSATSSAPAAATTTKKSGAAGLVRNWAGLMAAVAGVMGWLVC